MFYPPELSTWVEEVSTHLPHLSKSQAQMLAWYSFAVTIVQSSGLSHEYALRNWQEQSFRDLKSGGWHWGESRVHSPEHVARLLILLVLAHVWVIALGSQAVAAGISQPLIRRKDGTRRRHWSLFKEGLRFLVEFVRRHTICSPLIFIPDIRFT